MTSLPAFIGKYELQEFLGGGMSQVYRARDTVIGRTVAVKILTDEGCGDPEVKERFLQEARMAGNVSHDNVISIYDYGESEGRPFLVMEYMEGEDLRSLIKAGRTGSIAERVRIASQIARAVEFVHSCRIIHRDIKPDNVRINARGVVKLMDFGIAKVEGFSRTQAGFVLGTPYYMAPEQVRGDQVSYTTDVYAFGILTYELFTGTRPFKADTIESIFHHILSQPIDVAAMSAAGAPGEVVDLTRRCTEKDPATRPQDFTEIVADLDRALAATKPSAARAPGTEKSAQKLDNRRRAWLLAGAGAAAVVVLLAAYVLTKRPEAPTAPGTMQSAALAPVIPTPTGRMILVPAGDFHSGEDKRQVNVGAFYMDETEVSNAAFRSYCRETSRPCPSELPADKPDHPVTGITIDEARDFARWAGKQLASATQWEKAARGADGRRFPWGESPRTDVNVGSENPAAGPWEVTRSGGDVSPWRILNMGGNVAEYVDERRSPSAGAIRRFAALDPPASASERWYTVKGGSYVLPPVSATTWEWGTVPARYRSPAIGFRCVREVQQQTPVNETARQH